MYQKIISTARFCEVGFLKGGLISLNGRTPKNGGAGSIPASVFKKEGKMLLASIKLDNFRDVEIHQREVNGKIVDCVSIPMEENGIYKYGKFNNIILSFSIKEKRLSANNKQSHYISLYTKNKKLREEIERLGYKERLKFLGHAIYFAKRETYNVKKIDLDNALEKD